MVSSIPKQARFRRNGAGLFVALLVAFLAGTMSLRVAQPEPVVFLSPPSGTPTHQAHPSTTPRMVRTPVIVRERNFGSWSYITTRGEKLYTSVSYNSKSVAGLVAYANTNRASANLLAVTGGQVEVSITFSSLIQPSQYREWVDQKGIVVELTSLRTLDPNGVRGSLGILAQQYEVLPQSMITTYGASTVSGVYNVRGTVPANRLAAISSDPLVFLADVSKTLIRRDLITSGVPDAGEMSIRLRSPFWEMEDLGLEHFR